MGPKKTCSKCKRSLSIKRFYREKRGYLGRRGDCIECNIRKSRAYQKTLKGSIAFNAGKRRWAKSPRGKASRKRYVERNRIKMYARGVLRRAVQNGEIKRGKCVVRGCKKPTHGHHEDYTKPLDVIWMCERHHKDYHAGKLQIKVKPKRLG